MYLLNEYFQRACEAVSGRLLLLDETNLFNRVNFNLGKLRILFFT